MRLKRLRLLNCCQHAELDWEFSVGLIGIMGSNGSGKSNAMNLACYAGFTNDYSRHTEGKSGYIRQQASGKDKSEIRLSFTQDEEEFEIIRGLQAPVRHQLNFITSGKKPLMKATEIQAELEEVLGIRRRIIEDFVFVDQHSLFAFLSAVASERAKSFAHLCNTVKAEQIWEMLKDQINADAGLVQEPTGDADAVRSQIGEYKGRIREARKKEKEYRNGLLTKTVKTACEKIEESRSRWAHIEEQLPRLKQTEADAKAKATKLNMEKKAVKLVRDELLDAAKGDAESLEVIISDLATLDELEQRWARKQNLEARLKSFEEQLQQQESDEPVNPGHDVEDLGKQSLEARIEIGQYESLLGLKGKPACPVCGTTGGDLTSRIDAAATELPISRDRMTSCQKRIAEQSRHDQCRATWYQLVRSIRTKIDETRMQLAEPEMQSATEVEDMLADDLVQAKEAIESRQQLVKAAEETFSGVATHFEAMKGQHQATKKQLRELLEEQQRYAVSDEEFERAERDLESHRVANSLLSAVRATITEVEGFIAKREEELARIQRMLERGKKARVWLADLQEVRDEVMHRDMLPKVVHRNALLDMEEDINEALDLFESPFSVKATPDVGFIAHFPNGTIMPAGGLSGGQKVMLAVPYRLTVNSLFAVQVGMMVLDEPTDGLDEENRVLAAQVFVKLGEVARSRGHQIIVITHDESLAETFDQRFVLERPV